MTIPAPESQGGGSGITDDINLYFYLENYTLDSVRISFLRGVPKVGYADLNDEGNIDHVIRLSKLVDINLSYNTNPINLSLDRTLEVTVTLTTIQTDSVRFIMLAAANFLPRLPAFFIRKIDSEENILILNEIGTYFEFVHFVGRNAPKTFNMPLTFSKDELPAGTYEIIFYTKFRHIEPPPELVQSLGENIYGYNPDFLSLPYKRTSNIITITR